MPTGEAPDADLAGLDFCEEAAEPPAREACACAPAVAKAEAAVPPPSSPPPPTRDVGEGRRALYVRAEGGEGLKVVRDRGLVAAGENVVVRLLAERVRGDGGAEEEARERG